MHFASAFPRLCCPLASSHQRVRRNMGPCTNLPTPGLGVQGGVACLPGGWPFVPVTAPGCWTDRDWRHCAVELRFRPSSALGQSDLFSSFLPPSEEPLGGRASFFKKTVCISRLKGQIVPLKLRGLAVLIFSDHSEPAATGDCRLSSAIERLHRGVGN